MTNVHAKQQRIVLPPVDLNTKIDVADPKAHIMNLFLDLLEGVGTMENIQVHLDVNPEMNHLSKHQGRYLIP